MKLAKLIGKSVVFHISDPWEFGERYGCGPFSASITDATDNEILIQLKAPLDYEGVTTDYMVVTSRLQGMTLEDLKTNEALPVDFTPVVKNAKLQEHEAIKRGYTQGSPFHVAASWRGWGLTGDVQLK